MELLPFLVFFCLCSFSIAAPAPAPAPDDTYNRLVHCLTTNSIPSPQVQEIVYNPASPSFTPILQAYIRNLRFNFSTTPKPNIIITPKQKSHVQAAVICSKMLGLHIKIRSGGNDYEGLSYVSNDPFTVLDMSNFQEIHVDINSETAWVQTAALVGELYYRISEKSKVHGFPAGTCVNVGTGGQLSGSGYGNLLRKYGLTVDNVVDAEIVDVNGKILDRKGMGEDLFWAINGGGGASFGVVLAFKIKLVRVPPVVTVFNVGRTLAENATDIVFRWQSIANKIDPNLFVRHQFTVATTKTKEKTIRVSFKGEYLGGADTLVGLMNYAFPQLGLKKEDCKEMSWIESTLFWDNYDIGTPPNVLLSRNPKSPVKFAKRRTDYIREPIPVQGLESLWKKMIELGDTSLIFNPYGGKMDEILPTATAFPHRAGNIFMMQYLSNWFEDAATDDHMRQGKELYEFMTPFVAKNPRSAFFNYRDIDVGSTTNGAKSYEEGKVYGEKYFGVNFDRLVKVKTAVDPENFFRNEQSIPVAPRKAKPRVLAAQGGAFGNSEF